MPKLYVVLSGKFLHLPKEADASRPLWLPPGGVVDMSDPFIVECVKGQEYKLGPADEGVTQASPLVNQRLNTLRAEFYGTAKPKQTPQEAAREEGAERAESEGLTGEIQKPSVPKPKGAKKGQAGAPEAAAPVEVSEE